MPLLPGVVAALLSNEDNALRFERVCTELYRNAEGIELVPTSRTWDRGRDARGISLGGEAIPGVLCATLSANLEAKVEADIRRLAETTRTRAIVYCASQALTEAVCDRIEAAIRKLHPSAESVRVLGQTQLAALGERFEDVLRRYYAAEIQSIERALLIQPSATSDPEHIGLRLALITQTGDDARALRNELARRLVLDALSVGGPQNPGQLAVVISGQLHLARSVTGSYVGEVLSQLANDGLVSMDGPRANLTAAGVNFVSSIPQEASTRLLEGRTAIREAIRSLSGHTLTDDDYDLVWNTLQDGLAEAFYSHGAAIVRMVASLLSGEGTQPDPRSRVVFQRLGDKVEGLFPFPEQASEVRQAVIDMFSEKGSEAFAWLTQMCTVYVMMCSLGIEALTSQHVMSVLRGFSLVPDSDIVLSLLCDGEDNHEEVDRVIAGWKALGGKILMAVPVLEEAAYHAWISERDYVAMVDQFDRLSDLEASRLIENAFVRTFRHIAREKSGRRFWNGYIAQYRGDTERDYRPVAEILQQEYGFGTLPSAGEEYEAFATRVTQFLVSQLSVDAKRKPDELNYRARDKCRRDGLLVAAVSAQRDRAREARLGSAAMLLSSARLLSEAGDVFRNELGKPDAVLPMAALGFLLTLAPGVQMGLGTLRGLLFDMGLAARLTPMQRYAYRLMAASDEFDVPWSRRGTLQRELARNILADARLGDRPVPEIRQRVLSAEDPHLSARIVAGALDEMAVTPETRKLVEELREEIRRLQQELRARDIRQPLRGSASASSPSAVSDKAKDRGRRR